MTNITNIPLIDGNYQVYLHLANVTVITPLIWKFVAILWASYFFLGLKERGQKPNVCLQIKNIESSYNMMRQYFYF